ncbi:MAG: hypothetical protein JRG91_21405, partial [Deltaproteobacteria bacterium]|nr:hypothetical protein [Deltaproteobacteria bacterium]
MRCTATTILACCAALSCSSKGPAGPTPVPGLIVLEGDHGTLEIDTDPFSITLRDADGVALLSTPADPVDDADAGLTFGTFAALEATHYYNPAHTDPDSSDRRWVP